MSRVGVKPIEIPEGVEISFDGNTINVKGPKGELSRQLHPDIKVNMEDNVVTCERPSENTKYRSLHGTTRSLINNMVVGVSQGFEKSLEINGVGYRAQKQGDKVVINAGYSHPVEIDPVEGIEIEIPKNTQITVKGIDKEAVGAAAANIRAIRPPEPYKGKGIKYANENIRSKEGKASK